MRRISPMLLAGFFLLSCQGQEKQQKEKTELPKMAEEPKGNWRVDKEFDENGNLIRYDSIYSWSSTDNVEDFMNMDRDSIFQSFSSQFSRSFSGMGDLPENPFFSQDSIFMKRFFADDFFESEFGQDFMDLDKIQRKMEAMQKQFLERYHPKPSEEKGQEQQI